MPLKQMNLFPQHASTLTRRDIVAMNIMINLMETQPFIFKTEPQEAALMAISYADHLEAALNKVSTASKSFKPRRARK